MGSEYGKTLYQVIVESLAEAMKPLKISTLAAIIIGFSILAVMSIFLFFILFPLGCLIFVISVYLIYGAAFAIYEKRKNNEPVNPQ